MTAMGIVVLGSGVLMAGEKSGEELFVTHCAACHITDLSKMDNKNALVAPPADEVMTHIKEDFASKEKAVGFMSKYILHPDPSKSHCASIETFGLMPSQQGVLTPEQATAVTAMMYDKYPRKEFTEKEKRSGGKHRGMSFDKIDQNHDGVITPREFQLFRARKNHMDPNKFVNTYYFDRLDLNGDGKMERNEFEKMKAQKQRKRQKI
jgi:hypothetical protein